MSSNHDLFKFTNQRGNMKTKILELLKTKFTGVQESVLSRIADKLAKTALTDEQATTAVEGVTIQTVIDSYADSRVGEATNTAVSNYEKKHGIKDGKPVDTPVDTPPAPGADKDIAKIIADALKPLQDKIASFETGKTTETRRQTLAQKLTDAKAPEVFKNQILKTIDKMNLSDEEYAEFETEVITNAGQLVQEAANAGLGMQHNPFGAGAGTGGKDVAVTDIKKWAEQKNPATGK